MIIFMKDESRTFDWGIIMSLGDKKLPSAVDFGSEICESWVCRLSLMVPLVRTLLFVALNRKPSICM